LHITDTEKSAKCNFSDVSGQSSKNDSKKNKDFSRYDQELRERIILDIIQSTPSGIEKTVEKAETIFNWIKGY